MTKRIDERKNYRFPMFDDETPVKQVDEVVRVVLQKEYPMPLDKEGVQYTNDLLTSSEAHPDGETGVPVIKEPDGAKLSDYELNNDFEFNYERDIESPVESEGTALKEAQLKPDFTPGYQPSFQTRVNRKKPAHSVKPPWQKTQPEAVSETPDDSLTNETETSVTKRFIPKYIPESRNRSYAALSKDEENKQAILKRFKKEQSSYLLIDETVPVEESPGDTQVVVTPKQSFKRDISDIPFTRREFKKLSHQEKEKVEMPSEAQLKNKATGRPSRLDRGLQGILDDDASKKSTTRYFE